MNKIVKIVSLIFSFLIISWLILNLKFSNPQSTPENELQKFDQRDLNVVNDGRVVTVVGDGPSEFDSFTLVLSNGQVLHSLMAGEGQTLILLVHGADRKTQNADYWKPFIPQLSKHGRVVAVDMLGYGASEPGSESSMDMQIPPKQQAISLLYLISSLQTSFPDIQEVVLLARSYGGRVVAELLNNSTTSEVLSKISKVVLIAPAIGGSNVLTLPDRLKNIPYLVFWAQDDPVVPSTRLWELKQVFPQLQEVMLKKKDFSGVTEDLSAADYLLHTPELLLKDFFMDKVAEFLTSRVQRE